MKKILVFLILIVFTLEAFDKVVVWGHKLHTHTHSYIHEGFYRAFKELGYRTRWLDDRDLTNADDFSNTLFLTEGQVDENIPLRQDCFYLVHNPSSQKYNDVPSACFQVYTDSVLTLQNIIQVEPFIYYYLPGRTIFMPWATDLLPNEIDEIKSKLPEIVKENNIYWVGTIGEGKFGNLSEIKPFILACKNEGLAFIPLNPYATGISRAEHIEKIQVSYMAPAIVGDWQKEVGYIPCRIFKNISYGQMGITNSRQVYELFEGKIIYNPDTYQLFYDAQARLKNLKLDELYDLMDFVKTKHTYLNRAQLLIDFVGLLQFHD